MGAAVAVILAGKVIWSQPGHPSERTGQWFAVGLLLLAGAALLRLAASGYSGVEQVRMRGLHPKEPWRWRRDWNAGYCRCEAGRLAEVLGFIGLFVVLMGSVILYDSLIGRRKPSGLILLGVLLLSGGLALVLQWLRQWVSRRRFGAAELRLDAVPVALGSVFHATVRVPRTTVPGTGWHWMLTCVGRADPQEEENAFESLVWQDEYRGDAPEAWFTIPASAPERTPDRRGGGGRTIRWKLQVRAGAFQAEFDVPVFAGPVAAAQPLAVPPRPPHRLEAVRIRNHPAGHLMVEFLRGRKRKMTAATGLFTLVFAAAVLVQRDLRMPLLIQAVTALVTLLLGWLFLDSLLSWSRVEAGAHGLRIRNGWGERGSVQTLDPAEVQSIEAQASGHAGGRIFYDVIARTRWGKKKRLGGGICRGDADAVVLALIERLAASSQNANRQDLVQ